LAGSAASSASYVNIFYSRTLTYSFDQVGSVIIALNGPKESTVGQIREFEKLFVSVGFLVYGGVIIAVSIGIIFFVAPK
jgi:hypothetical protein